MKTIHVRGDPNPVTTTTGNEAQITVVACVSNFISPMIVWDKNPSAPPLKQQVKPEVCTARVLTTLEYLKLLEEKQRPKEVKQKTKEEKQKAREEKK